MLGFRLFSKENQGPQQPKWGWNLTMLRCGKKWGISAVASSSGHRTMVGMSPWCDHELSRGHHQIGAWFSQGSVPKNPRKIQRYRNSLVICPGYHTIHGVFGNLIQEGFPGFPFEKDWSAHQVPPWTSSMARCFPTSTVSTVREP